MAFLKSAIVPIGRVRRAVWKLSKGQKYARGNSSMIAFHPGKRGYIAQRFRELHARRSGTAFRPVIADKRSNSWVAWKNLRAASSRFAVKFPTEFMLPRLWLTLARPSLPRVGSRRENHKALTFPGTSTKPEQLPALRDRSTVKGFKNRKFVRSDVLLGKTRQSINDYYSAE